MRFRVELCTLFCWSDPFDFHRLEKYEAQRMMISVSGYLIRTYPIAIITCKLIHGIQMDMDVDFFRGFFDIPETPGIKITPKRTY